jgi:hypothetical protein
MMVKTYEDENYKLELFFKTKRSKLPYSVSEYSKERKTWQFIDLKKEVYPLPPFELLK